MTRLLIKKFVKNPEDIDSSETRASYGALSSGVGIICNVFLFMLKYIMGLLTNSISIISDAFNNLSDSASCIITLLGYKMAAKPADKAHPFGHGRMEYLTSLIISAIIVLMGFELFKSSAVKLIHPEEVKFSIAAVISLLVSIAIKLWMSFFNGFLGRKIKSVVMIATSQDSRNDVITTTAALIALIASIFTDFPVDAVMGIFVSVFILKSGYEIIKDTVDELIGKPVSHELTEKIRSIVTEDERIMGIHDLIIHSYGPGNMIGSCHVEVNAADNFVAIHELVDKIERSISQQLGVMMTIHMDPVDTDDVRVAECKSMINDIISGIDSCLHIHDFRIVSGEMHTNLIFDLVVPFDYRYTYEEIKNMIDAKLFEKSHQYFTVITFDADYS